MRAAGLMDEATGVNIAITNACGSRAEALERQAHSLRQLMDAAPHVHASFWDMLVRFFTAISALLFAFLQGLL